MLYSKTSRASTSVPKLFRQKSQHIFHAVRDNRPGIRQQLVSGGDAVRCGDRERIRAGSACTVVGPQQLPLNARLYSSISIYPSTYLHIISTWWTTDGAPLGSATHQIANYTVSVVRGTCCSFVARCRVSSSSSSLVRNFSTAAAVYSSIHPSIHCSSTNHRPSAPVDERMAAKDV